MKNRRALRQDNAQTAPAQAESTVHFVEALLRASEAPGIRKTERTRLVLLAAVAALLNGGNEQASLRVSDIAEAANVAHGTFYRYFADREAAVDALIGEFAGFLRDRLASVREGEPASAQRVRAATLAYVRLFRANSGLMRCLMDLSKQSINFRKHFHALNQDWNRRVAVSIARRRVDHRDGPHAPGDLFVPTAYALGGMVDEFLAQLYLRRDPALSALTDDETGVADLLTELWCQGAYGNLS